MHAKKRILFTTLGRTHARTHARNPCMLVDYRDL